MGCLVMDFRPCPGPASSASLSVSCPRRLVTMAVHTTTHKAQTAMPLQGAARALGLPSATALVIGSIIGTGVFTMPAVMAGAGTSSIITLGVIALGAVLLGVLFGQLTKRVPNVEGGLYAYARHEFGDFAGYLTAWCYWITCWAGNAAIVASWVLYVESPRSRSSPARIRT